MAKLFGARLSVLHAGERSDEKIDIFRDTFGEIGREEVDVYWCEGETTARALVDAATSVHFDLFIAGTMARPKDVRNFTGTIVRELINRTPCDTLLIPDPQVEPRRDISACLMVEAHSPRWRAAKKTLEALNPSKISILAADSPFAARRAAMSGEGDDGSLDEICEELDHRGRRYPVRQFKHGIRALRYRAGHGHRFHAGRIRVEKSPTHSAHASGMARTSHSKPAFSFWKTPAITIRASRASTGVAGTKSPHDAELACRKHIFFLGL